MIRNLTVKRYRSLADVTLPFGTVRLLIGPNAAGKSNLIDALRLLAEAVRSDMETDVTRRGGLRGVVFLGAKEQTFAIGLEYFVPDPVHPIAGRTCRISSRSPKGKDALGSPARNSGST